MPQRLFSAKGVTICPMAGKTLFERIIDREIAAVVVHEDPLCVAFTDIAPQAPVHVLVVPRKPFASMDAVPDGEERLLGHLLFTARRIASAKGLREGYRIVINTGADGGQSVDHLHVHVIGGRKMEWPPG